MTTTTIAMGRRVAWALMLLVCCAPLVVWMASVNDPFAYFRLTGLPPGQQLYLIAKLLGLFALCLFWLQAMLALSAHMPGMTVLPFSTLHLHKRLGAATAVLILSHVVLFLVGTSLRTGHAAWDMLVPTFSIGYYRFYISLGVIAFYLVCLTIFAGWRTSRGARRWKWVHMLWPAVFALTFLHAFAIGTESRYGAMRYLVVFLAVSLTVAAIARLLSLRPRSHRHSDMDIRKQVLPTDH